MLAEVGSILAGVALLALLYAALATLLGIRLADRRWVDSGRNGVYAATGLLASSVLLLLLAFLRDQFQIRYVAQHSSRDLPVYLKVSAVWAGQEGSLLLWAFLQALFATLVARFSSRPSRLLVPWATVFLSLIAAFFAALTLFLSNPFSCLAMTPPDGFGLHPLLRHPGMIFHPPALYLGYVGLAVPFALALAALVTRRIDDWPSAARRWALAAWLLLGSGLLLGARWAYDVLGWGGYWGWDPVENAGLMPWLTATALLHAIVMQEQRRSFRAWSVLLAVLSFALVLFGAFVTRSGMIQSVHAFVRSALGGYVLVSIGLTLGGAAVLMISRRHLLADPRPLDGLLSRDGMFFLTLLLLLTITGTILVGSMLPTLTGQRFEAGPAWFDGVTGPQFAALVLLMGVCPLLGRAAEALHRLKRRGWPVPLGAVLLPAAAALFGFDEPLPLIGFCVIGASGGAILAELVRDIAARMQRQDGGLVRALSVLFGSERRRIGGYLVHAGVALMALGVVGTRLAAFETEVVLSVGETAAVHGYTLVYEGLEQELSADPARLWASVAVYRDGRCLGTLQPAIEEHVDSDLTVAVPALWVGPREDLYLVLAGWGNEGAWATFKVFVNPLVSLLWLGGLILLAGGAIAFWPPGQPEQVSAAEARRRAIATVAWLTITLLVLFAAGLTMWGSGHGATVRSTARPLAGQPAPGFAIALLDGSTFRLSEQRGQVLVVNFWATWCPPCEDELPDLQATWEEYQAQGVTLIGIAYQDQEGAVQEYVDRYSLTYPVGLDPEARVSTAYGITGVPETFVVDADGQVAYVHIGPVNAAQLRATLERLLDR